MKSNFLIYSAAVLLLLGGCKKNNQARLVNTWTIKNVSVDGTYTSQLSEEIGHYTGESTGNDSALAIKKQIEKMHEGVSYNLRADGTCTIKYPSGDMEAKWAYSTHPEKDVDESGIVRFTKDGKELETWQFYGNDLTLGADCRCLNVLMSTTDETMKKILGDENVVLSGNLHPASEEGLEHY